MVSSWCHLCLSMMVPGWREDVFDMKYLLFLSTYTDVAMFGVPSTLCTTTWCFPWYDSGTQSRRLIGVFKTLWLIITSEQCEKVKSMNLCTQHVTSCSTIMVWSKPTICCYHGLDHQPSHRLFHQQLTSWHKVSVHIFHQKNLDLHPFSGLLSIATYVGNPTSIHEPPLLLIHTAQTGNNKLLCCS